MTDAPVPLAQGARNAVIEECAQIADRWPVIGRGPAIAAAIRALAMSSTPRVTPDEPRDALGQTASEVYSSDFAPPSLRDALEDLLKDIDESHALGMPVLLRRDTIAQARAALALSSSEQKTEYHEGDWRAFEEQSVSSTLDKTP